MAELQEDHPSTEELLSVIVVQNQRIYDVLLLLLGIADREAYEGIVKAHKEMDNLGPAPFIMREDEL